MKVLIIGTIGIGLMSSLIACHKPISKSDTVILVDTKDSVSYIETFRDVPVHIAGDSIPFFVTLPCDNYDTTVIKKPFHFQSRSKRAKVNFTVDSKGSLSGVCACEEEDLIIQAKDTEINRLKKNNTTIISEIETVVRKVSKLMWYSLALNLLFIIGIVYKLIRFIS